MTTKALQVSDVVSHAGALQFFFLHLMIFAASKAQNSIVSVISFRLLQP